MLAENPEFARAVAGAGMVFVIFSMSFFTPYRDAAAKEAARMQPGRYGMFVGKAKRFNGSWQIAGIEQMA